MSKTDTTTPMGDALARAEAMTAERLMAHDEDTLRRLARTAGHEANDIAFTDLHRLQRFALRLIVEAELARRAAAAMAEAEAAQA